MQKTKEREISTMIVKKTNIAFSDNKEVEELISKVKASLNKEDKITLLNKASEKLKLLSHTLEGTNLDLSYEIGAILDLLITKEKKIIHKKDKELVKETTSKMTKLVKVKDKVCKQVEQDSKFNTEGLEFLHSKKKELEEEKKNVSQDKKIDRDIVKLEECIKICSNIVDDNSSKLEQLDRTSPISLSPTSNIFEPNKETITNLDEHLCKQKSKKLPIKVIKKKEDYFLISQPIPNIDNIYLIRRGTSNSYKIGYSCNVISRLSEIQTSNDQLVTLVACCPGSRDLEKKLHVKYYDKHIRGEWFKFNSLQILKVIHKYTKLRIKCKEKG